MSTPRPDRAPDDLTQTAEPQGARTSRVVMQPYLFLALDGSRPLRGSARWSLAGVGQVCIGRGATGAQRRQDGTRWIVDLALDDPQVSRDHVRIERTGDGWEVRDLGSRNGTVVDGERLGDGQAAPLPPGTPVLVGRSVLFLDEAPALSGRAWSVDSNALEPPHPNLATVSPALERDLAALARIVSNATPSVLLRGPTGSGKEMIARAVHDLWARRGRTGPFVAVNCGGLPEALVEAELFGARRGAFSGATEHRTGLVRAAEGGTLFLDEVADLEGSAQAALLRVLETKEVLGLGETKPVQVDVAFVAATHRDLEAMMEAGELRRDLYARLAAYELFLPALADRSEDLGLLVARLLRELGAGDATFTADAALALSRHAWPLNVRELKAALVNAVALSGDAPIGVDALPKALQEPAEPEEPTPVAARPATGAAAETGARTPRDAKTRATLVELLTIHRGNVAAVARAMGKHRRQIDRWMERFHLRADDFRT